MRKEYISDQIILNSFDGKYIFCGPIDTEILKDLILGGMEIHNISPQALLLWEEGMTVGGRGGDLKITTGNGYGFGASGNRGGISSGEGDGKFGLMGFGSGHGGRIFSSFLLEGIRIFLFDGAGGFLGMGKGSGLSWEKVL